MTTTNKTFSKLLLAMSSIALVTMLSSGTVFADSNDRIPARIKQADKNYKKSKSKDRRYRRDGNSDQRSDRNARNNTRYDRNHDRRTSQNHDSRKKKHKKKRHPSYRNNHNYGVTVYSSRYHDRYGNYYDSYRGGRYTRSNHRGHNRHGHYYDNKVGQWIALAVLFDVLLDD